MLCLHKLSVKNTIVAVTLSLLVGAAGAQAPTAADLENNLAFIKLDRGTTSAQLGTPQGMIFMAPITVGTTNYTYYIRGYTNGSDPTIHLGIGMAQTSDGLNFVDYGQVLKGETTGRDSGYASFPGVWYENGTFYLVYEAAGPGYAGDIGLATSSDGKNFVKQGIILYHNNSGWESTNIGTPSLYKENGIWYLHYHGFDGNTCQIGVASGANLMSLQKYSGNPIIKSVPGTWQAGTAGRRSIQKVGSKYYMVYEGSEAKASGAVGFEGVKWASGMASSPDLFSWTTYSQNNILPQTVPADGFGKDGPTFFKVGDATYIYYRVTNPNRSLRALIATESYSGFNTSWTMSSPNIAHRIGRVDGDGWSANGLQDGPNYLQYGPYYTALSSGDQIATWSLMIDNNSSDDLEQVRLEVSDYDDGGAIVAQRNITRKQWKATGRYEYFSVPFKLDPARLGHRLEFRVYWYGRAFIREGKIGLS